VSDIKAIPSEAGLDALAEMRKMHSKVSEVTMWAVSGTGEDFRCVHLDDADKIESELCVLGVDYDVTTDA